MNEKEITEENGISKFLEYLGLLKENINSFEIMVGATELASTMPLSEEQITAMNLMIGEIQNTWNENFIELLKLGVEWLEKQTENNDEIKEG